MMKKTLQRRGGGGRVGRKMSVAVRNGKKTSGKKSNTSLVEKKKKKMMNEKGEGVNAVEAGSAAVALLAASALPAMAAPTGVAWNVVAPSADNIPALMVPLICLLLPACAMAQLFVFIEKDYE